MDDDAADGDNLHEILLFSLIINGCGGYRKFDTVLTYKRFVHQFVETARNAALRKYCNLCFIAFVLPTKSQLILFEGLGGRFIIIK